MASPKQDFEHGSTATIVSLIWMRLREQVNYRVSKSSYENDQNKKGGHEARLSVEFYFRGFEARFFVRFALSLRFPQGEQSDKPERFVTCPQTKTRGSAPARA